MSDARQFVRLADEIALLERYAEIEQLRLGDRLRITWDLDGAPADALLPPLVLQPLLENAVYHGVEPGTGASDVLVRITERGERVLAQIENPYLEAEVQRAGNRMALENIRERLQLFFDAEARISHQGGRRALPRRARDSLQGPTDMSELKVFIADDEEPARERLKTCSATSRRECRRSVVGEARNGVRGGRAAAAERRAGAAARHPDAGHGRPGGGAPPRAAWSSRRASSSSPRTTATRWRRSS